MSSELQFRNTATGDTVYVVAIYENAKWVNDTNEMLETFDETNWTEYAISLPETAAGSYFYVADFPTWNTTAGIYYIIPFKQLGGSPAITDEILIKTPGVLGWDGTAEIQVQTIVDWLKKVKEGDNSFDISNPAQFQSVVMTKNTTTDLIRKDLQKADGTPITSLNTVIGRQVEP